MPSMGSLLHGIEISRTGGITQFINMYMVYDELPESLKRQVEGRKARHDFGMLSRLVGSPPPTAEEKAAMPPVWHPMVRTPSRDRPQVPLHQLDLQRCRRGPGGGTGAPADRGAVGSSPPSRKYMYRHEWEPHDVLMWDNRCTVHAVTPHDPNERRVMHRTTIVGHEPVVAA